MPGDLPTRPRVLLVDDDGATLAVFAEYLTHHGCDVVTARDGEEAIAVALREKVDIAIIDVMMPKLDGIGVVMALRSYSETRRLPLVTLSARTGEDARTAAIDAGADLALEKPYPPQELEAVIRVFVGRRRTGEPLSE